MRRRLAKIRQLVANDQIQDFDMEETNAVLFNSVYIGLDQNVDVTETSALLEAIDEELKEDVETATQSSWQSLRPTGVALGGMGKPQSRAPRVHGKKLTRSKGPSMEFKLMGLNVDVNRFFPDELLVSKSTITVRDVEILDHIKTSTWKKFLTALHSDSRGNIRETNSNMVKIELRGVRPTPGHPSEESRVRVGSLYTFRDQALSIHLVKAKILPLRLYVDQDAVDFLKKFFSFEDHHAVETENSDSSAEAYIRTCLQDYLANMEYSNLMFVELAEIFSIDLKLDYKPRRVDYRALREGRTIELMNFFHFDGAEMTLRHITLAGVGSAIFLISPFLLSGVTDYRMASII
jgi:autophagy-related protein 2